MTWRSSWPWRTRENRNAAPLLLGMATAILSWQGSNAWSDTQPIPPPTNQALPSAPSGSLPTVTIEAKQELERRAHRFVSSEVLQVPGESIMRWNKPICPLVVGMPRMFDDYIQDRISEIARTANAPVGGKECTTDFYVIATYELEPVLKKLRVQVPARYDTRNGLGRFLHSQDPVRVLFNSKLHCRVNSMDGGKSADMMAFFLGGGGAQVDTTSPYFCGGGGSRLSYSAVNSIQSALIVVDMSRMKEVTTRELADYVAMIGLADIRPNAGAGNVPTILGLFQHPQHPAQGLSAWDRALLYSIYNTNQSSVLQMPEMERAVVTLMEHPGNLGQTSSPLSGSSAPLWVNEVIPQRDTNIITWYRAAAEHGDADAQYALGFMYDNGKGVQQNHTTAADWYNKAAEQGETAAQSSLGLAYLNGQGIPQNYAKAAQWLSRAAERGSVAAQYDLGLMYARGQGVSRSYVEAAQWFSRAAEQGYADAQFDLGVMYANGGGAARDDVEACKWWILARADSGSGDAAYTMSLDKLNGSAAHMTPAQMARAHRQASAWLAAHRSAR